MKRQGIILAGGKGTRLNPSTLVTCKQLLPVYNKPMIYYPLSTLMLAGIRKIHIISTEEDIDRFEELFGRGEHLGLNIRYYIQEEPLGIADAFNVVEGWIGITNPPTCLVLGDNIIYGHHLVDLLARANARTEEATIFGYHVSDPERYGVVDFDKTGRVKSIEEKPRRPRSNYAVIGIYFYPEDVFEKVHDLKFSDRGELEITDLNMMYLKEERLKVEIMGRGYAWLDTGTHEALNDASNFVRIMETRQGLKIGDIEEIAKMMEYI